MLRIVFIYYNAVSSICKGLKEKNFMKRYMKLNGEY